MQIWFGTPFCGPPIGAPNCCKTQLFLRMVKNGMEKADIAAFEKSDNFEKCSFQPQIYIEKCSLEQ